MLYNVTKTLPDRISSALKPGTIPRCLFGSEYIYKCFTEKAEVIGIFNMLI
jgi:hypothetical protein